MVGARSVSSVMFGWRSVANLCGAGMHILAAPIHMYGCVWLCCADKIEFMDEIVASEIKKKIHEIVTKNCCLPFTFCVCMPVCMLASVTLFLLVVGRQLSCCETIEISSANTFLVFNIVACTFQHKLI